MRFDWTEITNSDDASALMEKFGHFDGACLRELRMWNRHFVYPDLSMRTSGDLDHHVRADGSADSRFPCPRPSGMIGYGLLPPSTDLAN